MFERKMNRDMKTRFNAMKKEKSDLQEEFLEMKVKFHRVKEESQDHVRIFFFQAEDGIRDCLLSRGLGDVYKRQPSS